MIDKTKPLPPVDPAWRKSQIEKAAELFFGCEIGPSERWLVERDLVWLINERFIRDVQKEKVAPRRSSARRRIEEVRNTANHLLMLLDMYERDWDEQTDFLIAGDAMKSIRLAGLDGMAGFSPEGYGRNEISPLLKFLVIACDVRIRMLKDDRGGRTNLWKEVFGDAKYQLVLATLLLLQGYRGDGALKKSENGIAIELCRTVLLLAGEDPEAFDLLKRVKAAIKEIQTNPILQD